MRESILTIPVNDVFGPKEGCPICRMRNQIEQHICEYIMGAAMMEPDVRIETNKLGFCNLHYNQLLQQNNRLSLALMLNTHMAEKEKELFGSKLPFGKGKKTEQAGTTCFVCSKVNWGVGHTLETVFQMYSKDEAFRKLFARQEFICIPHYKLLLSQGSEKMSKGDFAAFKKALEELVDGYMKKLNADVDQFCQSFDYRNAGKLHNEDMEHVRTSVQRAVEFLTGRQAVEK